MHRGDPAFELGRAFDRDQLDRTVGAIGLELAIAQRVTALEHKDLAAVVPLKGPHQRTHPGMDR